MIERKWQKWVRLRFWRAERIRRSNWQWRSKSDQKLANWKNQESTILVKKKRAAISFFLHSKVLHSTCSLISFFSENSFCCILWHRWRAKEHSYWFIQSSPFRIQFAPFFPFPFSNSTKKYPGNLISVYTHCTSKIIFSRFSPFFPPRILVFIRVFHFHNF